VTLEDFQALCRHNDYVHDPESMCNCTAQVLRCFAIPASAWN